MPAIQMPMTIHMEDGTTYEVIVDQRDVSAFEVQPFGRPFKQVDEVIFTFMRWTAWHAMGRNKLDMPSWMSWKDFDKKCIEVTDQGQEGEEEQKVDPTIPAASADI